MISTLKAGNDVPPSDQMAALVNAGFCLIPLGGGAYGKSPLVPFAGRPSLTLAQVLGPMYGRGSAAYGIRLGGLMVADCDEYGTSLTELVEARFGASPVHVRTPRGLHLYYRAGNHTPNLRGEGLPIDIKTGENAYVVGPGSIRPDGGRYVPHKGTLITCELPRTICPAKVPARVAIGNRNEALYRAAIGMVERVDDVAELIANLAYLRDEEFADPASVKDSEIEKVAKWAWSKRCSNSVYAGKQSAFRLDRSIIAALGSYPNFSDALALFAVLQSEHGHIPGKAFGLNHEAMRTAGLTDLSRERFLAARRTLEKTGLMEVSQEHRKGIQGRQYRLTRPVAYLSDTLVALRSGG